MRKSMNKTDLDALRKTLEQLHKEAKQLGLPLARISSITDLEKTIKLIEKKRA